MRSGTARVHPARKLCNMRKGMRAVYLYKMQPNHRAAVPHAQNPFWGLATISLIGENEKHERLYKISRNSKVQGRILRVYRSCPWCSSGTYAGALESYSDIQHLTALSLFHHKYRVHVKLFYFRKVCYECR